MFLARALLKILNLIRYAICYSSIQIDKKATDLRSSSKGIGLVSLDFNQIVDLPKILSPYLRSAGGGAHYPIVRDSSSDIQ